jgi:AcrR family transcriptional regulator
MPLSHSTGKKNPGAPRWKRRAALRPEEILDAALAEFTENGFDAARMEDIGQRAGISKAGVYLYFPSKSALLEALIEAKVAPLARNAENLAAAGEANPLAALRLLARTAALLLADARNFAVPRLVIGLSGRFPELADYYRTHVVDIAVAALTRLFNAAIAQQLIRPIDPAAAVRAFIGPLFFEAMRLHVLRGDGALGNPEQLIDQHFDVLMNGMEQRA